MHAIILTWLHPTTAIRSFMVRPRWLLAFVLLSCIAVAMFVVRRPHIIDETIRMLPSTVGTEERDVIRHRLETETVLRASFIPVRMFIGWSLVAVLVWFVIRQGTPPRRPRYVEVLSAEVHAEAIQVIGEVTSVFYAIFTGWSMPTQFIPLSAATGADLTGIVFQTLNAINPFSLSYLIALSFFITRLTEMSKYRAFLTILLCHGCIVVLNISLLKLVVSSFHLKF